MDLDIGHLSPMMPIVSGAVASVHAQGNSFQLEYKW
jgi:muramoyltetrapeptide carboxypeptidase LdcA involved in peptidoglycan recycling